MHPIYINVDKIAYDSTTTTVSYFNIIIIIVIICYIYSATN